MLFMPRWLAVVLLRMRTGVLTMNTWARQEIAMMRLIFILAIGISGSHTTPGRRETEVRSIVVINKDPEAPFFKAADYGIVGDAFDIVP